MRYGFADTLSGQLHFRACGAGPDIVLLPWLPATGRMYEHVMPHLARSGFRAIAFDLAGSGRSHKKCRNWTVQQYAADVLEVYALCLLMGYKGRYGLSGPEATRPLIDSALDKIRRIRGPLVGLSPAWAVPEGGAVAAKRDPWVSRLAFGALGCVILAILFLVVFKMRILSGVSDIHAIAPLNHP